MAAPSISGGVLTDAADSFVYNPTTDVINTIASIPRPTGETRALTFNDGSGQKMWVMGGGRTAPNPSNEVDVYDPVSNTWSLGPAFVTARRNFPTATDPGSNHIWLAGGYDRTRRQQHDGNLRVPRDRTHAYANSHINGNDSTATATATATATPTGSATPTPTATATAPATATPTASPTCTPSSFHVLIAYSDIEGPPVTLQNQILAEPGVTAVDLFDASSGTPTLAQLQPYNIVVAFSNNPYSDPVGMGNVLADYADTGGIVVGLNFDWFGPPFDLEGRWQTGGYSPFVDGGPTNFSNSCLGTYDTTHPLMQSISAGSLCAFFRHTLALSSGAVSVALYQDNHAVVCVQDQQRAYRRRDKRLCG